MTSDRTPRYQRVVTEISGDFITPVEETETKGDTLIQLGKLRPKGTRLFSWEN